FTTSFVVARHYSGTKFKLKWFWTCVITGGLWGGVQFNLAKNGYILLLGDPMYIFENNITVRWAALISLFMQSICIPSKKPFRAWL
ncbi:hypothetical protein, partial [Pseudomonas sp.]|uniref:hypothetical protein n=1 Tax=Pseudomonas sp. TaxID=306 RepID=UPI003CC59674